METHQQLTKRYDIEVKGDVEVGEKSSEEEKKEHGQPNIFRGTLKNYQLKGMNWLLNLYDQVSISSTFYIKLL